jgi:hypothetical protein
MGRKLLTTTPIGSKCSVKIYKDSEYGVFVVKAFEDGKKGNTYEYETNDKGDAHGTAKAQAEWLAKRPACRAGGSLAGARRRRRRR